VSDDSLSRKKDQAFALLMTVAFTAGPFGFGVRIVPACASWVVAWISFIYVIWNLEHTKHYALSLKTAVALVSTVVLIWLSYPSIHESYLSEKAAALSGDLVPSDDGKDHSTDPPRVRVGSSTMRWATEDGGTFVQMHADRLSVSRTKGKLQFSTTVRDGSGNMVVEVVNNHWMVSTRPFCWDKNYTDHMLEVKDGKGRVVLQVRLTSDYVQIQGEWHDSPLKDPTGRGTRIVEEGEYDEVEGIRPVFLYPSEKYWGKLDPKVTSAMTRR
jgi:hypothetical protein